MRGTPRSAGPKEIASFFPSQVPSNWLPLQSLPSFPSPAVPKISFYGKRALLQLTLNDFVTLSWVWPSLSNFPPVLFYSFHYFQLNFNASVTGTVVLFTVI